MTHQLAETGRGNQTTENGQPFRLAGGKSGAGRGSGLGVLLQRRGDGTWRASLFCERRAGKVSASDMVLVWWVTPVSKESCERRFDVRYPWGGRGWWVIRGLPVVKFILKFGGRFATENQKLFCQHLILKFTRPH